MNRRLMMAQQNKGFELVYDAASGTLPTEQGWDFAFGRYGGSVGVNGGLQKLIDNSLNVIVGHAYESCHYYPAGKLIAQNCEFFIDVHNVSGVNDSSKMGFLLTNGEKAMGVSFRVGYNGQLSLTYKADNMYSGSKWCSEFGKKTKFTMRARLESGVVSVWLDDKLLTVCSDLYNASEMMTISNSSIYLYKGVKNQIAFSNYGTYYVSRITYREW